MVWCSGWRLASAVSNAGALGLIGSGSMYPDVLRDHIRKCKAATTKPFGVNLPLIYPDIDQHIQIILDEGVRIVFTSAGNPTDWTTSLKENGVTVVHVISSLKFALKSADAGVDALVAEGFEAGGHNGIEETTTLCLVPAVAEAVQLPVSAAGGIATGKGILAAFALGAEGVQLGTRFALSSESSAHINFKRKMIHALEGDTLVTLRKLMPVRMQRNQFFEEVHAAEQKGATPEELRQLLGRSRAKLGIFEGDLEQGELGIGQVATLVNDIEPAAVIIEELMQEYQIAKQQLQGLSDYSV
jgi:enoyl-[acyl-carrier protein] reductase II